MERGMLCCLWIWSEVSLSRCVSVVPRSVVSALRCVPKSRASYKTWIHLPMGDQTRERRVVRVQGSEEKVMDLVGDILAPKSAKKISVCWKPSMNKVRWCRWDEALGWELASSSTSSASVRGWSSRCFMSMSHGRSKRARTIIDIGQPCGMPAGCWCGCPRWLLNELYTVRLSILK